MTTIHRAQVVLAHSTGIPKNNVVNTFHISGLTTAGEVEDAAQAVRELYVAEPPAGEQLRLYEALGTQIATNGHQVRMYEINMEEGVGEDYAGAPPVHVEPFDFLGRTAPAESHASEVACRLSMRNNTAVSLPVGRRRGGVFIGPLERLLTTDVGGDGVPRVHPNFRASLLWAAENMRAQIVAAGGLLVIYSRPFAGRGEIVRPGRPTLPPIAARQGSTLMVEQFAVDNAFDTVRRRGEASTAREFSVAV